jgi:AraC family ethanolamine operon transcriptional activator
MKGRILEAASVDVCASVQAAAPTVQLWRRHFSDADEQAACVPAMFPQRYDQVSCGRFAGEMASVDLDGVVILRERANQRLLQAGATPQLSLLWTLNSTSRYRCNGVYLNPCSIMLNCPSNPFEIQSDPSEMIAMTISQRTLTDSLGCGLEYPPPVPGVRVVPPSLAALLRDAVTTVLAMVDSGTPNVACGSWFHSRRDELVQLAMMVAELPNPHKDQRRCERTYVRVVHSACALLKRDTTGSLAISELCRRVGVSRRNLHYAFDAVLGMTPGHYLRSVRLNAVRRSIKGRSSAFNTVAELASQSGFYHPSRFTAEYKRQFGELPSQTARSAALASTLAADPRA